MEDIKQKRLREERYKLIYERLTVLRTVITAARTAPPKRTAADEYKPKCRDLAMMPEVRKLIEAPTDAVIDEQSLQVIVSMLPALEARWQRERKADLVRVLRDEHLEVQDGVDILDLATAVFQCTDCKAYLHHPRVLTHECVTIPLLCHSPDFRYTDYFKCLFEACGSRIPWSVSSYRVAPKLDWVRALVEMCGMDPKAATQSDMDRIGGKIVFDDPDFGATLMSWRRSVSCIIAARICDGSTDIIPQCLQIRYVQGSDDLDIASWRIATDQDKAAVKTREDQQTARMRRRRLQCGNMRCGWCDAPKQYGWHSSCNLEQLKPHLSTK